MKWETWQFISEPWQKSHKFSTKQNVAKNSSDFSINILLQHDYEYISMYFSFVVWLILITEKLLEGVKTCFFVFNYLHFQILGISMH